jgi:hypothetical protein
VQIHDTEAQEELSLSVGARIGRTPRRCHIEILLPIVIVVVLVTSSLGSTASGTFEVVEVGEHEGTLPVHSSFLARRFWWWDM